ncbi:MAG: hypothetical protein ACM32E_29635 [Gemmatimonadota bacterium]
MKVLETGTRTSRIIEFDRDFDVAMSFTFDGTMAEGLVEIPLQFTIKYYYDGLGGTGGGTLGSVTGNTQKLQFHYDDASPAGSETKLHVPAQTLAVGEYRLSAVVDFTASGADQQMYAFTDGPVIEIVS